MQMHTISHSILKHFHNTYGIVHKQENAHTQLKDFINIVDLPFLANVA